MFHVKHFGTIDGLGKRTFGAWGAVQFWDLAHAQCCDSVYLFPIVFLVACHYTHWNEKSRQKILDGQGMVDANVQIRHFLRALYLDLASIPQEAIFAALQNFSSEFQPLTQIKELARFV